MEGSGLVGLIDLIEKIAKKYETRGIFKLNILNDPNCLELNEQTEVDIKLIGYLYQQLKRIGKYGATGQDGLGLRIEGWTLFDGFKKTKFNPELHCVSYDPIDSGAEVVYVAPIIIDKDGQIVSKGVVEKVS